MPTYEYQCKMKDCQHTFTIIQTLTDHDRKKVACPKCKSKRVKQLPSTFMANTSRKS